MATLEDAKWHLRIDGPEQDNEVANLLTLATRIVFQYVGRLKGMPNPWVAGYDPADPAYQHLRDADNLRLHQPEAEGTIEAAILLVLGELYANREAGTGNPLSPGVRLLLDGIKEPGYA